MTFVSAHLFPSHMARFYRKKYRPFFSELRCNKKKNNTLSVCQMFSVFFLSVHKNIITSLDTHSYNNNKQNKLDYNYR